MKIFINGDHLLTPLAKEAMTETVHEYREGMPDAFVKGERDMIPELEQERLPYFHTCKTPGTPMNGYNRCETYTACRI